MVKTEEGPIRLYHPWNQWNVGVQNSESPIPDGYERNDKHNYIPFPIVNEHGRAVPAKYVVVFMAANLYALGKLMSNGPAHTGEIHAAPHFDYRDKGSVEDLKELLPAWYQFAEVDTALSRIRDHSLTAEVHCYCHLMGRLGQLDEQMATIEKEMATLIPQKHQCIDHLMKAQAVCQEAALTGRTAWRRSGGGAGLGLSGKQLHPATPELTAWQERLADSSQ